MDQDIVTCDTVLHVVSNGEQGPRGGHGKSAYQIWLDQGNTGTEADFMETIGAVGAIWSKEDW
jgi:hypothetical protein